MAANSGPRTRCHLRHGPRLCRLRSPARAAPGGAFFVTRAKSNLDAHRIWRRQPNHGRDLRSDHVLDGYLTGRDYPGHLRRTRFRDAETGKTLVLLTNQMTLPALTICALYKSRWQVVPS